MKKGLDQEPELWSPFDIKCWKEMGFPIPKNAGAKYNGKTK